MQNFAKLSFLHTLDSSFVYYVQFGAYYCGFVFVLCKGEALCKRGILLQIVGISVIMVSKNLFLRLYVKGHKS